MIIVQLSFSIYTNVQFSEQEDLQKSLSNNFCPYSSQNDEEEYDEDGNIYQTAQSSNPTN